MNRVKSHAIIRLVGLKYWKLKSSNLQSLETGRKTEIDFLNGYISSKARELKLSTPINDKLIRLVKEIESVVRNITVNNFNHSLY
jgi:2-dehydropantoate 2-reductase